MTVPWTESVCRQHAVVPRLCFLQQPSGFSSDPSGSLSSPGISGIHFGCVPTSVHTDKCFQLLNFKCLKNPCELIEHFFKGSSGGKHYFKRAASKEMVSWYITCQLNYTLLTDRSMSPLNSASQSTATAHILQNHNPYLFADFGATANIFWAGMKQIQSPEVMRTMQRAHHILKLTDYWCFHKLPHQKERVSFICSWGLNHKKQKPI